MLCFLLQQSITKGYDMGGLFNSDMHQSYTEGSYDRNLYTV